MASVIAAPSGGSEAQALPGAATKATIREAQAELERAVAKAGLANDPIRYLLEATSAALGAFTVGIEAAHGARGLTPEGEADLVRRVADAAGTVTRDNGRLIARELRTRTILGTAGAMVATLLLVGTGAYYAGRDGGRASVQTAAEGVLQVASQAGPDATAAWLTLMRSNDPAQALALCRGDAVKVIDGRRACSVPLWLEPPPPPRVGGPPVDR